MQAEIIPAILVKTRERLVERIEQVMPYVKTVQIDVMDNEFVPNKTIGIEDLQDLPRGVRYEIHWMVHNPEKWIERFYKPREAKLRDTCSTEQADREICPDGKQIGKMKGNYLHLVHVEARMNWNEVKKTATESGGRIGIVINPGTPVRKALQYCSESSQILVMSVKPGFDGQKYIPEVEGKIMELRKNFPTTDIEIDGGINLETIARANKAGANKLVAASAIFSKADAGKAIEELKKAMKGEHG